MRNYLTGQKFTNPNLYQIFSNIQSKQKKAKKRLSLTEALVFVA